ncbi:CinA family protein [candidate division KSB1 bacterium]|nr:CinA family protein [candidate division KSB1 bacterium]
MIVQKLTEDIIHFLMNRALTIVTAESCTGGLIAKLLTDVPGASRVFLGGIVSYSNEMKEKWLGVVSSILDQHGAVSAEVTEQMVCGILAKTKANVGVAVSGIAGPTGGTETKPVGTVYISAKCNDSLITWHRIFEGDRNAIREQSAEAALKLIDQLLNIKTIKNIE